MSNEESQVGEVPGMDSAVVNEKCSDENKPGKYPQKKRHRIKENKVGGKEMREESQERKNEVYETTLNQTTKNLTKGKKLYIYGNYDRYYGYRVGKEVDEDPRLKLFKREWFEGRDCLDIGCNDGAITISVAQKFMCRSILGIDIDEDLVWRARAMMLKAAVATSKDGSIGEQVQSTLRPTTDDLQQRVQFREENFIETYNRGTDDIVLWSPEEAVGTDTTYDTILCLSVTKWVHLNWGDDGLIRLFAKAFHLLRPGGIFILEPQPWSSYKKKQRVSEVARKHFKEIVFQPDQFSSILLDKIGFLSVETVTPAVPNSRVGFGRSLYVFYKW